MKNKKIKLVCWQCTRYFNGEPGTRFCSDACESKYKRRERYEDRLYSFLPRTCENCGKSYLAAIGKKSRFCCQSCYTEWAKGENSPNWKGGISQGKYCTLFNEPLKEVVRNYFNNRCFECNKSKEENNRALDIHHINYQKQCGCDNSRFCIYIPLCRSCHMKTNGNRYYWYTKFMTEIFMRHPNYYQYHIPVWGMDELQYNFEYVFEKNRRR